MSSDPRVFATVDLGTATVAATLVGRAGGRWRLVAAGASPAGIEPDALLERLRSRLAGADPALARELRLEADGSAADLARLTCATAPAPEMTVVAASGRVLRPLVAAAEAAGWRVRGVALDGADILGVATALAHPRASAVLAGASDPPGADERSLLPELATLVAATAERRPGLVTVLAGGLAEPGGRAEGLFHPDRPGATVLAPAAAAGGGEPLRELLDGIRGRDDDGRRALARATGTLAEVLERRVEVLEIGRSGGLRAAAGWSPGQPSRARWAAPVAAALLPPGFTDRHLDTIIGWLTLPLDRLRVRDRLRELAVAPWGDAAGDGALLRVAAARAALERLLAATPAFDRLPAPELVVAAGGPWAVAPAPAVALALADVFRRPGVRALGQDHARLLAPLGTIDDDDERRRVMADLRDDLLVPLGSVVLPSGLRPGRPAGRMTIGPAAGATPAAMPAAAEGGAAGPPSAARGPAPVSELELVPGSLELVDLPPGSRAVLELHFRDTVDLGVRARHVAVEVTGGLGGLLVDLRDVPLRLPERLERRRDLLSAWQAALWPGVEA